MGSIFGGSAPSIPQPTDIFKVNKKTGLNLTDKQLAGVTGYYGKALPSFMDLASQYSPAFIKQGFDFGNLAMTGFEGMQTGAGGRAADTMANLRSQELGLATGQTGTVRGLMESLSPEQAAAVAKANRTATQAQGLESDFMGRAGGMMGQYGSQVGQYGTTLGDISGYAGTTISDAQAQERAAGTLGGINPYVGTTISEAQAQDRAAGTLGGINPYAGTTISEAQAQELAGGTLGGINPYVGETISGANADVTRATQIAEEAFARRGALSAEEQRATQQQAREAAAASGRLGGNAAIAAEIQNREAAKAARRSEAAQFGQQAFGQQLGAAGQRLASEQALYGQRGANVERNVALQQARFGQGLGALQQRLATQQARYGQLGSEAERGIALQQARFGQDIAGREQQLQAQQARFGQLGEEQARQFALQQAKFGQDIAGREQQLQAKQARYAQLGSEQERELTRRQNLFSQGIAGGAQRTAERQLGFNQLMDIEQQRAKLRDEAAQSGVRSYEMAKGFYTTPGLELFKTTPTSYTAGTNLANIGLNLGKSMSPELDYNLPLGLALNRAGALDAAGLAQFQADMQANAARNKMIGDIIGTAGSFFMASDRRLKTDIKRVGTTDGGLPIYTYKYKGQNTTQMGVMAQDVEKVNPDAVAEFNGFKAVNYSLIS